MFVLNECIFFQENKNKFQKAVESKQEEVQEKNGRNLDETGTCPQISEPTTSSKRYDQRTLPQVLSPLPVLANPAVRGRRKGARGRKRKQERCLEMKLNLGFAGEEQRLRGRENFVPLTVEVPDHDSPSTIASDMSSDKSPPISETDTSTPSSLSKCESVNAHETRSHNALLRRRTLAKCKSSVLNGHKVPVPSICRSDKSVIIPPKPATDKLTQLTQDNEFILESDKPIHNVESPLISNSSILKVEQENSSDNHSSIPTCLVPSRHKTSLTSENFTPSESNSCVSISSKPKVQITFGNSPHEQNKKRRYRFHPRDQNKYIQKSISSFIIVKKGV